MPVSETEAWEKRASTLIGLIGTPAGGAIGAMVAASMFVDCEDLNLPLQQQQCIARMHSISDNGPAIVGGFLIGAVIALVISGIFQLIGERAEQRIQRDERRRQSEQVALFLPAAAAQPKKLHDDATDQLLRPKSPNRRAGAEEVQEAWQQPSRAQSAQAERDEPDERDRFSDY